MCSNYIAGIKLTSHCRDDQLKKVIILGITPITLRKNQKVGQIRFFLPKFSPSVLQKKAMLQF